MVRKRPRRPGCCAVLVVGPLAVLWLAAHYRHREPSHALLPSLLDSSLLLLGDGPDVGMERRTEVRLRTLTSASLDNVDLWLSAPDGSWALGVEDAHQLQPDGTRTTGYRLATAAGLCTVPLPGSTSDFSLLFSPGRIGGNRFVAFILEPQGSDEPTRVARYDVQARDLDVFRLPHDLYARPLHDWCLSPEGGSLYYAAGDARIMRLDLATQARVEIDRGYAPALSPSGKLAYISRSYRKIVIADEDGRPGGAISCPVTHLASVAWSPDERWLCYQYGIGWAAIYSRTCEEWGIGVVELETRRHYRVEPRTGTGSLIKWSVRAGCLQWVERLPSAQVLAPLSPQEAPPGPAAVSPPPPPARTRVSTRRTDGPNGGRSGPHPAPFHTLLATPATSSTVVTPSRTFCRPWSVSV